MDLDLLVDRVRYWAIKKGLDKADPYKQIVKLVEEVGELSGALLRSNAEGIIDGIGDILVVLTILTQQLDLDLQTCLEHAYNEIKNRKGTLKNGVFIKENDK